MTNGLMQLLPFKLVKKIKEDGLTPASEYSVQWVKDFPIETPEETISNFLKVRRNLFQKIVNYNIKDVVIDDSGKYCNCYIHI